MNRFWGKIGLTTAILAAFGGGFVATATAQVTNRPTARRSGTDAQKRNLIQKIRSDKDNFRASLDLELERIRLTGEVSDNLNDNLNDFDNAVLDYEDRLRNRQAVAADVENILNAASQMNSFLRTTRFGGRVDRDWATVKLSLNQLAREYNLTWNGDRVTNSNSNSNSNYPTYGNTNARLNGTFRLDASRSDNARTVADNAVRNLPTNERQSARQTLEQRLESPDAYAIEQQNRQITIASSRAPRYSFEADGRDKFETADNGSRLRVRASLLSGERLEVTTSGDRGNDYTVTFEPTENGRRLRVTRRISADFLRQAVVTTSVYERTNEVAQLDIYERPELVNNNSGDNRYPRNNDNRNNRRNGTFVLQNDTQIRATLNEAISTKDSKDGDRFTMTLQMPEQYRGAVIEGSLSNIKNSGKVTGRAELSFNFETIRLNNGQVYDFNGFVESIRNLNGDEIKIDNEGSVQGENQGKTTATRGALGAGIGAIIGAIAGGGKGAAIGAIIGAGAGAGSVYIEGRENLELNAGSDVYIRTSSPNNNNRRQ